MPVYTVMAENADGDTPKLHNEAARRAGDMVNVVERYRANGLQNIRIYCETQEIGEAELRVAAAAEARP